MKRAAFVVLTSVLFLNCMGQKSDSKVFKKLDSKGRLVEKWGNEGTPDHNVNFREFYFYDDSTGLLQKKRYFDFEDENKECTIAAIDSLRYTEFWYIYGEDGVLHLEQRYDPVLDANGNVVSHKLSYVYNHILKFEDVTSPTYER